MAAEDRQETVEDAGAEHPAGHGLRDLGEALALGLDQKPAVDLLGYAAL